MDLTLILAVSHREGMPGKRNDEKDERVKLPLDPETAMRALLAVDPNGESYPPARHSGIMRTVGRRSCMIGV